MFSVERNPAILLFAGTQAKSRAMSATQDFPGVRRSGCGAIRRVAPPDGICAGPGSRPLDTVRAGSSDTSSPARLRTSSDTMVTGRPEVAIARKNSRNPLKPLIPRPGSGPLRGAIGAGSSDRSSPARLRPRPETAVAGRLDVAIARKNSRNPLKPLIPRPGSRPLQGAIGAGSSDRSCPARLRPRPETAVAGRLDVAIARKNSRKPLKTLIPRPGSRPHRGAIGRFVGHVVSGDAQAESRDDGRGPPGSCVARRISRNPLKPLNPRPGSRRQRSPQDARLSTNGNG